MAIKGFRGAMLIVLGAMFACVSPSEDQGGLGVRVQHLTSSGPQAGLPEGVDTLSFIVEDEREIIRDFARSLVGIADLDGDGSEDREAAVQIPPDREVSITVLAHSGPRENLLATARVDGLIVPNGGRRYVSLTFSPVRDVSSLPESLPSGRFGHANALAGPDGRVLITGGFTVSSAVDCPASLASAAVCFRLEATSEALLLDPASGALYETRARMLSARALHTATSLPDGRVLVAGGVDAAIMGLERRVNADGDLIELTPTFVPVSGEGYQGALRSFELFDPQLLAEEEDVGRDGDPEGGGFVGAPAEPTIPGQMNTARFLHAATPLPGDPSAGVLLVGGQGSVEAPITGEVFLARRSGGSGFLFPPQAFADTGVTRGWPAAAVTEDSVFVMGGATDMLGSLQIGERWLPGEGGEGAGRFSSMSECPGFVATDDRPNNAILGGASVVFGHAERRVLVAGWLGPLCTEGSRNLEQWDGTVPCATTTYANRSFTVGASECTFGRLQDAGEHGLGAAAALPNGGAILAGGFSNGLLSVTDRLEVLTGEFNESTHLAMRAMGLSLRLGRGRAWLTATELRGGRVFLAGGMNFVYDGGDEVPTGIDLSNVLELYDPGWDPANASSPAEGGEE